MNQVIGLLGASGGVGASTLAAAITVRAAAAGRSTVCIDARPHAGGLDVVLGLEQSPGLRWDDLVAVDGPVDGPDLLERLPALTGGAACLAHSRLVAEVHERFGAGQPSAEACGHIRDALTRVCEVVVVDLPWAGHPGCAWWAQWCDLVVLVCGDGLLDLAAAAAVAPLLQGLPGRRGLVVRERHVQDDAFPVLLASRLELPLLGLLPHDPAVPSALHRGVAPGLAGRGPLAAVATTTLDALLSRESAA